MHLAKAASHLLPPFIPSWASFPAPSDRLPRPSFSEWLPRLRPAPRPDPAAVCPARLRLLPPAQCALASQAAPALVLSTLSPSLSLTLPSSAPRQVVSLIRKAGGIPFTKTNVSQCIFFFECSNPVWGRAFNPHSRAYTCGGSSGGEAALLAMDGSALGWGSDIGGSLRSAFRVPTPLSNRSHVISLF